MSNIILKTKWKHNKIEEDKKRKEFSQQISRLRKKQQVDDMPSLRGQEENNDGATVVRV